MYDHEQLLRQHFSSYLSGIKTRERGGERVKTQCNYKIVILKQLYKYNLSFNLGGNVYFIPD